MVIISYVGSLGGPGPELNNLNYLNPVPRPIFKLFNSRPQINNSKNKKFEYLEGGARTPPGPSPQYFNYLHYVNYLIGAGNYTV